MKVTKKAYKEALKIVELYALQNQKVVNVNMGLSRRVKNKTEVTCLEDLKNNVDNVVFTKGVKYVIVKEFAYDHGLVLINNLKHPHYISDDGWCKFFE